MKKTKYFDECGDCEPGGLRLVCLVRYILVGEAIKKALETATGERKTILMGAYNEMYNL